MDTKNPAFSGKKTPEPSETSTIERYLFARERPNAARPWYLAIIFIAVAIFLALGDVINVDGVPIATVGAAAKVALAFGGLTYLLAFLLRGGR